MRLVTVAELIARLQAFDPALPVVVSDPGIAGYYRPVRLACSVREVAMWASGTCCETPRSLHVRTAPDEILNVAVVG